MGSFDVDGGLADLVARRDADVEGDAVAGGVGEDRGAGADGEQVAEAERNDRLRDHVLQVVVEEREVWLGGRDDLDARDELIGQVDGEAEGGGEEAAEVRGQSDADARCRAAW